MIIKIEDNHVVLIEGAKRTELEFAVVATAAELLREHLLALMPPELPPLPACEEPITCPSTD